jgi:hypothetical protein
VGRGARAVKAHPLYIHTYINPFHQSMCLFPLSLGNCSVNTLPRQQIHVIIEELLDMSFSIRSVSHQTRVSVSQNFSICTSEVVVWWLPEPSKSKIRSWVLWDSEPRVTLLARTSNNLLDKHVTAATKNCWRRSVLCGPCFIKGQNNRWAEGECKLC